jgi:hypothetical protein
MNWYLGNKRSLPISTHKKTHRHSFPRLLATALQSCVGSSPIDSFPQVQNPRIIVNALTLYLPRVVLPLIAPTPLVRVLTREAWFPPSGVSRSNGSSSYHNMGPSLNFYFECFSCVPAAALFLVLPGGKSNFSLGILCLGFKRAKIRLIFPGVVLHHERLYVHFSAITTVSRDTAHDRWRRMDGENSSCHRFYRILDWNFF